MTSRSNMEGKIYTVMVVDEIEEEKQVKSSTEQPGTTNLNMNTTTGKDTVTSGGASMNLDPKMEETEEDLEAFYGIIEIENTPDIVSCPEVSMSPEMRYTSPETGMEHGSEAMTIEGDQFQTREFGCQTELCLVKSNSSKQTVANDKTRIRKSTGGETSKVKKKIGPKRYMDALRAANNKPCEPGTDKNKTSSNQTTNTKEDERPTTKTTPTKSKSGKLSAWDIFMELNGPKWQPFIKLHRVTFKPKTHVDQISATSGGGQTATRDESDLEDNNDDVSIPDDEPVTPAVSSPAHPLGASQFGNPTRGKVVPPTSWRSSIWAVLQQVNKDRKRARHMSSESSTSHSVPPETVYSSGNEDRGLDDMYLEGGHRQEDVATNHVEPTKEPTDTLHKSADNVDGKSAVVEDGEGGEANHYVCDGCDKKFYTQKFLKKHLRKYNYHERPKSIHPHTKVVKPDINADLPNTTIGSTFNTLKNNESSPVAETNISVVTHTSPVAVLNISADTQPHPVGRYESSNAKCRKVKRLRFHKSKSDTSGYVSSERDSIDSSSSSSSTLVDNVSSITEDAMVNGTTDGLDEQLPDLISHATYVYSSGYVKSEVTTDDYPMTSHIEQQLPFKDDSCIVSSPAVEPRKKPTSNSCEFCGQRFKRTDRLMAHRIRHTGETPHKCPYCPKEYAYMSALYLHKKTHVFQSRN